jgi:hypothetical protein
MKQQLRLYQGLYGEIAGARYEGIFGSETHNDLRVYEMAYALDLSRSGLRMY